MRFSSAILLSLSLFIWAAEIHAERTLPTHAVTVVFDEEVTAEQRHMFLQGARAWSYANRRVFFRVALDIDDATSRLIQDRKYGIECAYILNVRGISSAEQPDLIENYEKELNAPYILGLTRHSKCGFAQTDIVYDRLTKARDFISISAHEVGHSLGLDHLNDSTAIMSLYYNRELGSVCVTKADALELCRVTGCKLSNVTVCVPQIVTQVDTDERCLSLDECEFASSHTEVCSRAE